MTTLSEFFTQIRGFTGFTDPEVQSDSLILSWLRMAEERCSTDLRVRKMVVVGFVEATDGLASLPANFREADFVGIRSKKLSLEFMDYQDFYANENPAGHFSFSGNEMYIGGRDVTGTIDLHYYADVPQFAADSASWLMDDYPSILTFATLAIAYMSMQEPVTALQWNAAAQARIDSANNEYKVSKTSGSRLRRKMRSLG